MKKCVVALLLVVAVLAAYSAAGAEAQVVLRSDGLVVPCQWEDIGFTTAGMLQLEQDGKLGLMDRDGKVLAPPQWEWDSRSSDSFQWKGKNEYLGQDGQLLGQEYDEVKSWGELYLVRKGFLWGAINGQNQLVVPVQFQELGGFYDGLAPYATFGLFGLGKKWGLVNDRGEVVVQAQYDAIVVQSAQSVFFSVGGKGGLMDGAGQVTVEPVWDGISPPMGEYCLVDRGGKRGVIDLRGQVVVEPAYQHLGWFAVDDENGRWQRRAALMQGENGENVLFHAADGTLATTDYTMVSSEVSARGNCAFSVVYREGSQVVLDSNLMEVLDSSLLSSQPGAVFTQLSGRTREEGMAVLQEPDGALSLYALDGRQLVPPGMAVEINLEEHLPVAVLRDGAGNMAAACSLASQGLILDFSWESVNGYRTGLIGAVGHETEEITCFNILGQPVDLGGVELGWFDSYPDPLGELQVVQKDGQYGVVRIHKGTLAQARAMGPEGPQETEAAKPGDRETEAAKPGDRETEAWQEERETVWEGTGEGAGQTQAQETLPEETGASQAPEETGASQAPEGMSREPIVFEDPWVEHAVCQAYGLAPGSVSPADLWQVESLSSEEEYDGWYPEHWVETLDDLRYMPNLRTLYIKNGGRSLNLKGINKCPKLQSVSLVNCLLNDVERIGDLQELETLNIVGDSMNHVGVKDYAPLARLGKLRHLWLADNEEYVGPDGGFLASLSSLETLRIADIKLENVSLAALPNLREVRVNHMTLASLLGDLRQSGAINGIEKIFCALTPLNQGDLALFAGARQLRELAFDLHGGDATGLEGIQNLENLRLLRITLGWEWTDISAIGKLTRLSALMLQGVSANLDMGDFDFLTQLTGLRWLRISVDDNVNLAPMQGMKQLEVLQVKGGRGDHTLDLTGVEALPMLQSLVYSSIRLKSSAPLDDMPQVQLENAYNMFWSDDMMLVDPD